jgi:hypothetical protein
MRFDLNSKRGHTMKQILTFLSILGIVLLMALQSVNAQSRISWEVRTGVDFPTQDLGDANLKPGFGFDGIIAYQFIPHTSLFGGWGWHRFTSDNSFAGPDVDFEETGYTFGVEFMHPLGDSPMDYYVRAGGIYNHIEAENEDGDITYDTGHGLGWQAETGVAVELGNKWILKPGVRYRSLSRDFDIGNTTIETDLTTFNFSVGISRSF